MLDGGRTEMQLQHDSPLKEREKTNTTETGRRKRIYGKMGS